MARSRKSEKQQDRSKFLVGLVLLLVVGVAVFEAFTMANPFSHPYKVTGYFQTSSNLRPHSPVRIAGVEVGQVSKVSAANSSGGAKVEMSIKKNGLPLHTDATMKIRPRIFLEGNFFVDVDPGSPSAPVLKSGKSIPITQTATPVQLGDLLNALDKDTRDDLVSLLGEYGGALYFGGAKGINDSIPYWKPAYRDTSLVNEAFLGAEPDHDLRDVLRGQQQVSAALDADQGALKGLVTNFNTVAGALASQDTALGQLPAALRDTLRVSQPALKAVDDVLPTLRVFAREALPGVRSSGPALAASIPFLTQLRLLSQPSELQGAARALRTYTPSLVTVTNRSVPLLVQLRALSACTSKVLVPFINSKIPDPDFPENSGSVNQQLSRGFVGLSGESRQIDGNGSFFNTEVTSVPTLARPAPPLDGGSTPPVHRPDIPCETQDPPNLEAPGANVSQLLQPGQSAALARTELSQPSAADKARAYAELRRLTPRIEAIVNRARAANGASGASGASGVTGATGASG